ncbi:MAG: CPBP family intramembrane metalloprotease [Bryobacterales bacterium]|nr:CPBP family intramembrane metalloprotease [Bryobacterales bacterium]MBV9398869.1 CPBP family intramembrane metalloprotease [Bryobacterales bacterium]
MSDGARLGLGFQHAGRIRRFTEGTAAVAVWMIVGLVFRMSANAYLLLGIPIAIGFQRYVRREPLPTMWVRKATPFHLGIGGITIAILLMVKPLIDLADAFRSREGLAVCVWFLVAMTGAWPAAYALRNFRRANFRELLICLATAGAVGCAIMVATAFALPARHDPAWAKVRTGLGSFLNYVPVIFLVEEVWFRGVLDSHLHHPGERRGALSAIYVSALWGVWHYPISAQPHHLRDLLPTLAALLAVHIAIGALLSWSWRRSGNLFVPGSAHALIDAVRNAMFGLA